MLGQQQQHHQRQQQHPESLEVTSKKPVSAVAVSPDENTAPNTMDAPSTTTSSKTSVEAVKQSITTENTVSNDTPVASVSESTPTQLQTDDSVKTDNDPSSGVTKEMLDEEQELEKESEQELQKEKAKLKMDQAQKPQFVRQLDFLLRKTTAWSALMGEQMAMWTKEQEDKEKTKEDDEKKVEEENQDDEEEAKTRATRSGVVTVSEQAKPKRTRNSRKRKVDDEMTEEELVKKRKILEQQSELTDTAMAKSSSTSSSSSSNTATTKNPNARQPALVTGGNLRDYQLRGMQWLASLWANGMNGILGDEMGLGKTVQTISLIAHLYEKGVKGPFIVVAPLSTLPNWMKEFRRWTPGLNAILYHGTKDDRADIRSKRLKPSKTDGNYPTIVTSFEIAMKDRPFLQRYRWKYMAIDEGHRIKNLNCRLIRELKMFPTDNRLLLTGTPLQNNLLELWSLLNFVEPRLFADVEVFQAWFDFDDLNAREGQERILTREASEQVISKLHSILKPFLLRRTKADVCCDLPQKKEILLYAPLTPLQREYYQAIVKNEIHELIDRKVSEATSGKKQVKKQVPESQSKRGRDRKSYKEVEEDDEFADGITFSDDEKQANAPKVEVSGDGMKNQAMKATKSRGLQNTLMQLRKAVNHPYLFNHPAYFLKDPSTYVASRDMITCSGKLLLLDRLLPNLFENGHRVLIFSQMTAMLDILEEYLEMNKWAYGRIDGGVGIHDREEAMTKFNTDTSVKAFLLSTRAGGLGLNLTGADTVIIFDSDWNPQMDLQAQDRCHRIGQSKPVIVYRLVTAGSAEAKILERASAKRKLEKLVISKGKFQANYEDSVDSLRKDLGNSSNSSGFMNSRLPKITMEELSEILQATEYAVTSTEGGHVHMNDSEQETIILPEEELNAVLDRSAKAFVDSKRNESGKWFRCVNISEEYTGKANKE